MTENQYNPTPESCLSMIAAADTDVILCNSPIQRPLDVHLAKMIGSKNRRSNVTLILVTTGGDADVAYRMARCLQSKYKKVTLAVSGYCKSAGTLLALGAHEIIMTEYAELGPLDVQVAKKDDLGARQSGLTIPNALKTLQSYAYSAFEEYFLNTIQKSDGTITTQTASKIACELTTGLFSPIYAQIDPIVVGEQGRAISVAQHYGMRLVERSQNSSQQAVEALITQYPSHGFVIDIREARNLFRVVREPSPEESFLFESLGGVALMPASEMQLSYLTPEHVPAAAVSVAAGTDVAAKAKTEKKTPSEAAA